MTMSLECISNASKWEIEAKWPNLANPCAYMYTNFKCIFLSLNIRALVMYIVE